MWIIYGIIQALDIREMRIFHVELNFFDAFIVFFSLIERYHQLHNSKYWRNNFSESFIFNLIWDILLDILRKYWVHVNDLNLQSMCYKSSKMFKEFKTNCDYSKYFYCRIIQIFPRRCSNPSLLKEIDWTLELLREILR